MTKIPFDIKFRPQIESGEYKVETRDGRRARIICWDKIDAHKRYPIIALVPVNGMEETIEYTNNGLYFSDTDPVEDDLFIITPEEELTPFEKELATIIGFAISQSITTPDKETATFVKDWSEKLLSLAREQFIKEGYVIEKKAFHDAVENVSDKHLAEMSVQYSLHCKIQNGTRRAVMNWSEFQKLAQKFIDIGKAEALKDLPDTKCQIEGCTAYIEKPKDSSIQAMMHERHTLREWLILFQRHSELRDVFEKLISPKPIE